MIVTGPSVHGHLTGRTIDRTPDRTTPALSCKEKRVGGRVDWSQNSAVHRTGADG